MKAREKMLSAIKQWSRWNPLLLCVSVWCKGLKKRKKHKRGLSVI